MSEIDGVHKESPPPQGDGPRVFPERETRIPPQSVSSLPPPGRPSIPPRGQSRVPPQKDSRGPLEADQGKPLPESKPFPLKLPPTFTSKTASLVSFPVPDPSLQRPPQNTLGQQPASDRTASAATQCNPEQSPEKKVRIAKNILGYCYRRTMDSLMEYYGEEKLGPRYTQLLRDQTLDSLGGPDDFVEAMLVENMILLHRLAPAFMKRAAEQPSPDGSRILMNTALQITQQVAKHALALQAYRQPHQPPQILNIQQQNLVQQKQQSAAQQQSVAQQQSDVQQPSDDQAALDSGTNSPTAVTNDTRQVSKQPPERVDHANTTQNDTQPQESRGRKAKPPSAERP